MGLLPEANRLKRVMWIYMEGEAQSLFTAARMKEELQELLGCKVDIVRLRERMNLLLRNRIEREGIYV